MKKRIDILERHTIQKHLSTKRGLYRRDLERFAVLVRQYPHSRIRVYSAQGFVANSYKYRCDIEYIERGKDGRIHIGMARAQRSHGIGSTIVCSHPDFKIGEAVKGVMT